MRVENWKVEYGDRVMASRGEILRTEVGSGVHGIAIEGTDDQDEMGIYIEPPEHLLGVGLMDDNGGFSEPRKDYIARTQPEGARSGPGDVDLVMYSLGKYLRLAMKGNPTALLPLYAPSESIREITIYGNMLRANKHWFLSQRAVHRFLGYLESQHERMMGGGKRNRVPNRPELIEQFGWDVKYGSHALRLAFQGYEIAKEGKLTLPMFGPEREEVLAVKRGEVPQKDVSDEVMSIRGMIQYLLDSGTCAVPEQPDFEMIQEFAITARQQFWMDSQ